MAHEMLTQQELMLSELHLFHQYPLQDQLQQGLIPALLKVPEKTQFSQHSFQ